jgi:hypothetical protein
MQNADKDSFGARKLVTLGRRDLLRAAAAATVTGAGALVPRSARAEVWEQGEEQCRPHVKERALDENVNDAMLTDFMQLSGTLADIPLNSESDRRLGRQYLERFARIDELADLLPKLIDAYKKAREQPNLNVADALMGDASVRPVAEQVIYLWYLSAFYLPLSGDPAKRLWVYGTTEQFERALLWKVVHAHAPMAQPTGKPTVWAHAPRT